MTITMMILLVAFEIKHFLGDYILQTDHMALNKGKNLLALLSHTSIHTFLTFVLSLAYTQNLIISLIAALIEFVTHTTVDHVKASPSIGGQFNPSQRMFWTALGADQAIHHIVNILIIFIITQ